MSENRLSSQAFMGSLFPKESIFKYERLAGRGWCSPGGKYKIKELLLKLTLQPGDRVLEIGCGPGGSAVYMAKFYGVHVHGVDICNNMIDIARERLTSEEKEVRDKVHFELADITKVNYDSDNYDVIYSLDSIVFIDEKEDFFKKLYKWLKPGGTLLIGDICGGNQEQHSKAFQEFIKQRRYHLRTIKDYSQLLEEAGFKDVAATDDTNALIKALEKELIMWFQTMREAFTKDYTEDDFNSMVKSRKQRLDWCRASEHLWGIFQANK